MFDKSPGLSPVPSPRGFLVSPFFLFHLVLRHMDRRRWVVGGPSVEVLSRTPFPCLAPFGIQGAGVRGVRAPSCVLVAPHLGPPIGPRFPLRWGGCGGCPKWRGRSPRQVPSHCWALARPVALLATGEARGLCSAFTPLPLVIYLVILHVGVSVVDSVETIIHRCLGSKSSF